MKYKFNNPIINQFEIFSTREEAESRLSVVKQAYIEQEAYRFTVVKEIVEGTNTTWTSADLNNDIEDYVYQVFNHTTGLHEQVPSLTVAKERNQELKNDFLNNIFFNAIIEYEEPQATPSIPSTTI